MCPHSSTLRTPLPGRPKATCSAPGPEEASERWLWAGRAVLAGMSRLHLRTGRPSLLGPPGTPDQAVSCLPRHPPFSGPRPSSPPGAVCCSTACSAAGPLAAAPQNPHPGMKGTPQGPRRAPGCRGQRLRRREESQGGPEGVTGLGDGQAFSQSRQGFRSPTPRLPSTPRPGSRALGTRGHFPVPRPSLSLPGKERAVGPPPRPAPAP